MRVAALTSSRADFGILSPLLRDLDDDDDFDLSVIAFGSHLDDRFGRTVDEIAAAGLGPGLGLPSVLEGDGPADISRAIGRTIDQFGPVWSAAAPDLILALGDRYEMFAAIAAALPFGIPVAHLHGGETTRGAIDNAFRHSITHMSTLHFAAAEPYRRRVVELIGEDQADHVANVGALSIDNLRRTELLSIEDIGRRIGVDFGRPTVLITFHPETVGAGAHSGDQFDELTAALRRIGDRYQMVVTLPNADTTGLRLRERWAEFLDDCDAAVGFDSLGSQLYLSCMKHCAFMLGNSSSGYIEASWFPKTVIDLGDRQDGRIVTPNIVRCAVDREAITSAVDRVAELLPAEPVDIYGDGHATERILAHLRRWSATAHG